jgi:hypothetical protein
MNCLLTSSPPFRAGRLLIAFSLLFSLLLISCGSREQAVINPAGWITGLEVEKQTLLADGVSFGSAGAYEVLSGTVHYAADPSSELNSGVVDLALAAGSDGLVRYSADILILKPVEMARGNGALQYTVVNRGNFDTRLLSAEPWAEVATSESGSYESLGRMMKQGWTVVFSGWQDDLIDEDRLNLYAPIAKQDGQPLSGPVLSEFGFGHDTTVAYLGAGGHRAYPVAAGTESDAVLRVHASHADPGTVISRDQWRFASLDSAGEVQPDSVNIYYPQGFEIGTTYTLGYTTAFSPVMGLAFPAVRDLVSFLCSEDTLNPLLDQSGACPVKHTMAYGSSQCGRFLRDFIYQGFNLSPAGGKVFDGVFANVPGCRRGFFNYRFSQPSRAEGFYPDFVFPFTDLAQTDPVSGKTGGIMAHVPDSLRPKTFYIHHTGEYWSSGAGLTHASVDGTSDVDLPSNVRIYTFAGTAHGSARLVDGHPAPSQFYLPYNPNTTSLIATPLLEALGRWVMFDESPPQSSYPRVDAGELVAAEDYAYPSVPDVEAPVRPVLHPRFGWGDNWRKGVMKQAMPELGPLFPVLVPAAGDDGNELGGLRTPHVTVPVASYIGWNYPAKNYNGAESTSIFSLSGGWLPFCATRAERKSRGDSRKSLDMLYKSRGDYLDKLRKSCEDLVAQGLMFGEDIGMVLEQGGAMYDFVAANGAWRPGGKWGNKAK